MRCVAAALLFLSVIATSAVGQATAARAADTVYVAPATGMRESDRASIIAALERTSRGDVVQFAPGTYVVGELIRVTTSQITLLGHPDGTTLRGCAPEDFVDADVALFACNGLELAGSHQTVRDLTFEYAWHGLFVGCCFPADMAALEAGMSHLPEQPGGHIVESNTFRNSSNGLRVVGQSAAPIIIRGNHFVNTFHALAINGGTAHVLGNDVSAPEPERVPIAGHTGYALTVAPEPPNEACGRNVIAGNRVEGHTDAIRVRLFEPGTRCRGTVIRDNTIVTHALRYTTAWGVRMGSPADSGLHGVPIAITNVVDDVADLPSSLRREGASGIDSTIVEGNTILGGSGLGIEVLRSSGNRIVNNTISGITRRDPFPGNTANSTDPENSGWQAANGAGIWISPGSDRNMVAGNRISDVAAHHVVLEGDENVVAGVDSAGGVLDLGTANRVVRGERERVPQARRRPTMMKRFSIVLPLLASGLAAAPLAAQAGAIYETKLVEAGDIRIQYHDFGGSGLPVIFVQDFHDYFGAALDPSWPPFLTRFSDGFRVLAPVRRGWGESDDTGYGYDVATQAEDLLAFMDALGVEQAVLVGRTPADHDMTWIAEHHPERLAGLIYLQSLHVVADYSNPLIRAFTGAYSAGSCDMRDPVAQVGARTPWRPHFLRDESARIDVPALRFFWPVFDEVSMNLRRLDRVADIAASPSECAQEEAKKYFVALAADEERQAELREALLETDLLQALDRTMQRAFGDNLRTIRPPEFEEYEAMLDFQYRHMRPFLEDVQHTHAQGTQPDTAEVMAAAESFLAAFNNLEWDAFHASFAPSATVFQPFGEPSRNDDREEIAAFFGPLFEELRSSSEGGPPYLSITPRDLRIEMLDDAGIVTFHLPGEEAVGRRTLVFGRKRSTDPWRLFHLHASSLERPESRDGGGAATRDLDPEVARRYAGRYALQTGGAPRMNVVFRPGDGGLEAELGGQARALRYLSGHTFQEVESGFLFVFDVEQDGRAMGIRGLPPELDRVEVFARVEDGR